MAESDGREVLKRVGPCKSREAFYQGYGPSHTFGITNFFYQCGNLIIFPVINKNTPAGLIQQGADGFAFGKLQEGVAQKILREVDHCRMDCVVFIPFKIGIVIPPVMGQIGTEEYDIAGLEAFDMIADELGATAMVEVNQFDLGVVMPAIVYKRLPVFPDTE